MALTPDRPIADSSRLAFRFVLAIGIVNLFADMTYEGGRGIAGPFLGFLGASASIVGLVAGFGELVGFGLRSVSGYLTDRTRWYWPVAFLGYAMNLLAVPALALAGSWPAAAALVVLERTGRAIRKPAVDTMLSHAGSTIGHGWVFGLNEALDQVGATMGPLMTAWVLYRRGGDYYPAFAILLVPALLCLGALTGARTAQEASARSAGQAGSRVQSGGSGRSPMTRLARADNFSPAFWVYLAGGGLVAAGFADFSLIAFHFQHTQLFSRRLIPVLYAAAMATGAIAAPILGRLLDNLGRPIIFVAFSVPVLFAPLVFLGDARVAVAGVALWGFGMAAQSAVLKAHLVTLLPAGKRSTGFGVFDTVYGLAWFAGSAVMGILYDTSITALVVFSMVAQAAALPFLVANLRAARPAL